MPSALKTLLLGAAAGVASVVPGLVLLVASAWGHDALVAAELWVRWSLVVYTPAVLVWFLWADDGREQSGRGVRTAVGALAGALAALFAAGAVETPLFMFGPLFFGLDSQEIWESDAVVRGGWPLLATLMTAVCAGGWQARR